MGRGPQEPLEPIHLYTEIDSFKAKLLLETTFFIIIFTYLK